MKNKNTFLFSGILLIIISVFSFLAFNAFNVNQDNKTLAHNDQKYSQVQILTQSPADFQKLTEAGLFLDGGLNKPGQYFETWLSQDEINMVQKSGVPYKVLIDDWDAYFNNRQNLMTPSQIEQQRKETRDDININHSIFGTMNTGAMKYSEVMLKLDSMRTWYPNLISAKWSIGNTYESRSQWVVRITKNPDAPSGRPQVLLHALIHAREPESMEQQFFFVFWLLENYNIDPIATYILNNREIIWLPIVNPDGYVYNEPGGGMWRANRHISSGQCGAVDPNRNYGTYQFWNSSNNGSSTDSCNGGQGTYRGRFPNSELETSNIRTMFYANSFNAGIGAHTYGNYAIKPYCWNDPVGTPDDAWFNVFLTDMTVINHYTRGFPSQTVGYYVRGGADDFYYYDSANTSHHTYFMTCETGTTGFWPTQAELIPLAQGMVWANEYVCLIAGPYVNVTATTFNQPNYIPGGSGTLKVNFRNKGVLAANNIHVNWNPVNNYITIPIQQYNRASLNPFVSDSTTFNFTIANNAPNNCAIPTTLSVKLDTSTVYTQTVYVYLGNGTLTVADSAENGLSAFTDPTSHWTVHTDYYHTPTHSFAYAPYQANANYSLTLAQPVNISTFPVCYLSFWNRYSLENGYDYGNVEVSSNNGTTWQTVNSYTGNNTTWTQQSFDITSYANSTTQLLIRFHLTSDNNTQSAGWWVDDIKLTNYCMIANGVGNHNNEFPKMFALGQNYPNPFNPVTIIKYQLPIQSYVTIRVYDILGKEIATLVNNERKSGGYYEVKFDGSNLASGMYFYKIEAGTFSDTKKMILIK
jgi:carboxypeptidase T